MIRRCLPFHYITSALTLPTSIIWNPLFLHYMESTKLLNRMWFGMENVDILGELLGHLDARSLAMAACVSRTWKEAAGMESVWEGVCLKQWEAMGVDSRRIGSVVTALGGYRRFYLLCLRPLIYPVVFQENKSPRKKESDCVNYNPGVIPLSLSLFSIDCYDRMCRSAYRDDDEPSGTPVGLYRVY